MKKANNDVEKFTIPFIVEINQKLKAGARDAWKQTDNYGYVDKGVGNQNRNNNQAAPRVAKTADPATNKRERKKCKTCGQFHGPNECGKERKRWLDPCPYCVSKGIPEPKRSSHEEKDCHFKNGQYTWREPRPAQTQAPPQAATLAPPQAVVTSHQGGNYSSHQGGNPSSHQGDNSSNQQGVPQQSEEQRENAVRSHFGGYLQNEFSDEMSVGSNNATTPRIQARVSVSAVRHSTRKRREEQIEELRS